jgi:CheY-like chemotaxis protein
MEEHGAARLTEGEVYEAYCRADDLLRQTQDAEAITRLRACARLAVRRLADVKRLGKGFSLPDTVKAVEAQFIARALSDAGGSVTSAARLLGISYQSLAYIVEKRHQDLLPARTPAAPRRKSIINRPTRKPYRPPSGEHPVAVLLAEADRPVASAVRDALEAEGWSVVMCDDGAMALRSIESNAPYDLLLVDYDLPNVNGLEIVRRARALRHRRRTPVVVLSASDVEAEAWGAGADAFLKVPGDVPKVAGTIRRLIGARRGAKKLR